MLLHVKLRDFLIKYCASNLFLKSLIWLAALCCWGHLFFVFHLSLEFIPPINIWKICIDLRLFSKYYIYTAQFKNMDVDWNFCSQGKKKLSCKPVNMSYLADSYISFTLKMGSVSKNTIFGLKWWWKVV